ncbi:MAG: glycoside hydrolase family 11 protein [Spirochaetales bacterium]|nr:glycoside hydrolase family 11 protein [Spirochaetales bacterium]
MIKVFLNGLLVYFFIALAPWVSAQTICNNATGPHGDYTYEYWKDQGEACMTLGPEGTFTFEWGSEKLNNVIVRTGVRPGIGNEIVKYAADYQPNGNSYLGVYGWMQNPLIEYYIIDSWGTWKPPGSIAILGTIETDGGIYDIYHYRRYMMAIAGPGYIDQYYNVRQSKRTSGTITVANHFNAWRALDMAMGEFYDVSFFIEAYQSSGYADVYELSITHTEPTAMPSIVGDVNNDLKIDIIDSLLVAQFYVGIPVEVFIETNGDVNHDGEINIIDALLIAQCYVSQNSCNF